MTLGGGPFSAKIYDSLVLSTKTTIVPLLKTHDCQKYRNIKYVKITCLDTENLDSGEMLLMPI